MNRRELLIKAAIVAASGKVFTLAEARSSSLPPKVLSTLPPKLPSPHRWVSLAETLKPRLHEEVHFITSTVNPQKAPKLPLGWRMTPVYTQEELSHQTFKTGEHVIVDFGDHYTGTLHFLLGWKGISCDAPARLRLVFGEIVTDVAMPLYPYNGWISSSWLPDEILNVDFLPQQVNIGRRHAFRYVRIEVIAVSDNFSITLSDISVRATSSAVKDNEQPERYESALLGAIDKASIRTLHECMQTVFEDGPRRDCRLWLGDLRLQAQVNYVSFHNFDLVKRCLYLFAGLTRADGYITACVYEKPQPRTGEAVLLDYSALFGDVLLGYLRASQDKATVSELWPIAKKQIELLLTHVGPNGLFRAPDTEGFVFIDWNAAKDQNSALKGLDRQAAMQGVLIYSCRSLLALGREISTQDDLSVFEIAITRLSNAAKSHFFDEELGLFISGEQRQISWASNAWLVLARVLPAQQSATALQRVMAHDSAVRPMTPYLYHHMVDALVHSGLPQQAKKLVEEYWGAMIEAGADTFWEAFDPKHPLTSPYGSSQINSFCHAWSCTPSLFIRNSFMPKNI
ncbi:sugar hydrolase (plasmid) [Klebsiella michiganensis]|uniref:alpha-L-rhamnosidase-related protein n=1 Tax=Klebsiella michiganensis TaxID=1134687 RepID=UPI002659A1A5|nr:sugar hydrolase [Klebsiella michiganensis]WKJ95788.1 sugar hydrolase [Klebsiella michiganensis]WKK01073.1 sugar hydrolase [Klebsiella michiganensis]WKK02866.1 sugar hydrolase [Klebsiella michiganensis]WKK07012.1 sugar hydrolase [Klebsiella michiganensis]